jgi:hypothetical protein
MTMRTGFALALFVLVTCGLYGFRDCTPHPDRLLSNIGFIAGSDVMTLRSAKYEAGGPGFWSWLPEDTGLTVTCGETTGLTVDYIAFFMGGDDHLGYSWEETVATVDGCDRYYDPDCEFIIPDEELCDHVGLPWVDVEGVPHPSSGCTVRRGARADQGTYVLIRKVFGLGDPMNTCATACDFDTEAGFCWAQFTGE